MRPTEVAVPLLMGLLRRHMALATNPWQKYVATVVTRSQYLAVRAVHLFASIIQIIPDVVSASQSEASDSTSQGKETCERGNKHLALTWGKPPPTRKFATFKVGENKARPALQNSRASTPHQRPAFDFECSPASSTALTRVCRSRCPSFGCCGRRRCGPVTAPGPLSRRTCEPQGPPARPGLGRGRGRTNAAARSSRGAPRAARCDAAASLARAPRRAIVAQRIGLL
jgi:hypothetical protein